MVFLGGGMEDEKSLVSRRGFEEDSFSDKDTGWEEDTMREFLDWGKRD